MAKLTTNLACLAQRPRLEGTKIVDPPCSSERAAARRPGDTGPCSRRLHRSFEPGHKLHGRSRWTTFPRPGSDTVITIALSCCG